MKTKLEMKNIVLFFSVCLFAFVSACAQQKKYISYTVKEGENVKKIAKKHDVKSKDILSLNPGLSRKPDVNTVILIPNVNYNEADEKAHAEEEISASENHIVLAKETIYGISKKYNVSIESLKSLNPDLLIDGLKIGMVLVIPTEKMLTPEEIKQNELDYLTEHFMIHTVVKDDTIYNLTRRYNVSESELEKLNPILTEGLKLGMILKIRLKPTMEEEIVTENRMFVDTIVFKDTINVSMLLPFKFTKNDTLTKEQLFTTKNNLVSIITDFYLGADIAIDSLRKQGAIVDVHVYDTENDRDTIKAIVKQKKFKKSDVVFGPVFSKHVNYTAGELRNVPFVFPFYSSKQKNFIHDNIVKTVTDRDVLKNKVMAYFSQIYNKEQVVIVGDESLESRKEFREIKKYLKENNDSLKVVNVLQPEDGYISKERFVEAVDTLGVNWVILTTNNKVVTADVVNNLKSIPNDAEVRLFAFEKSNNFDKVDNNMLAKLNFVYASSGVLIDSLTGVSSFYSNYFKKNKAYPSEYATKGFDAVYDVLMRMASNDSLNLKASIDKGGSKRVRSNFKYEQKAYGEPIFNTAVYLRKYNDDLSIDVLHLRKEKELLEMKEINDVKSDSIPLIQPIMNHENSSVTPIKQESY